MNKETFLTELRAKLYGLPPEDIEERLAFYNEMINDRMEDGLTEEEAVGEIGSVDTVVEQIMAEIPFTALVRTKVRPKRKLKAWELVLLICGAPVWFPLAIAACAVAFSLYIVIWAVLISLYAADLSLTAGAIASLAGIAVYLKAGNPAGAAFAIGAAAVCAGLAILLFFACIWLTQYVIYGTNRLMLSIKKSFVGKED
ncbi:MAG: DUF1700 domain-containing protein [Oscillospiraceae bacterium]|nr:DUF1700 domain-containing protein [Oscillospiraceae bacterium]